MKSKLDDIRRAEQNGNHTIITKLQDEYAELECMDACVRILSDRGPLDRYEEIAKRAEHASPWFAGALMRSVEQLRVLDRPCFYEAEMRAVKEKIGRADGRELVKLQKEYAELECMDACVRILSDRGPLDRYEEIAKRNEHISPWYSNHLLDAIQKKRQLLMELENR